MNTMCAMIKTQYGSLTCPTNIFFLFFFCSAILVKRSFCGFKKELYNVSHGFTHITFSWIIYGNHHINKSLDEICTRYNDTTNIEITHVVGFILKVIYISDVSRILIFEELTQCQVIINENFVEENFCPNKKPIIEMNFSIIYGIHLIILFSSMLIVVVNM